MPEYNCDTQNSSPRLEIRLFGAMEVLVAGHPLPAVRSRSTRWLLALLALRHGRPTEREWLAATLWPDGAEERSLFYLRRALTDLRQALGHEAVRLQTVPPHGLILELTSAVCDVADFDRAAAGHDPKAMERAVMLCRGPLLEGCLEEWALSERSLREQALQSILAELAQQAAAAGDAEKAAHWLRRLLLVDPAHEDAQRRLMECLAAHGDFAGVVQSYRAFRLYLHNELQTRPTPDTVSLYERLRKQGRQATPVRLVPVSPPPTGEDAQLQRTHGPADILEPVGGAMPLDSSFYVTRPADRQFMDALARRDSIVLIKGPRQVGKTSLLARGLQTARQTDARVIHTDFQELNSEHLVSTDALLQALAASLADSLELDTSPRERWDPELGANMNMNQFLRRMVLRPEAEPVVWGLDEVDRLFGCDFGSEVFGLFRSWHNRRALEPNGPWSNLTLVMAYATEAHLFITDLNQSPFNVGTRLTLEDFGPDQVSDLNTRYGNPLRTPADLSRFYDLVGGQPFLVRCGLDALVAEGMDSASLEAQAISGEGAFAGHLQRLLVSLSRDTSLTEAVRCLLRGESCLSQGDFFRLRSAGTLAGTTCTDARFRCRLYQDFLAQHLI